MAVAVIGSALRARHPRDVYLDPREFSGVVVVLGIWNPTETADNASAGAPSDQEVIVQGRVLV